MNKLFSKKLISALLAVLIILSTFTIAFADSDEPAAGSEVSSDPASVDVTLPDSVLLAPVVGDNRDYDTLLRQTASVLASGDIDVEDIYNILVKMSYVSGTHRVTYTDDVNSELIYNWLTSYISNSGGLIDDVYDIKLFLYDMLESQTGDNLIEGIYQGLDLFYKRNHTDISSVINLITSCNTKLDTTNNYLSGISTIGSNIYNRQLDIKNSIDIFKSANHTDITSLQTDYNNIGWLTGSLTSSVYIDSNLTQSPTSESNYRDLYYLVNTSSIPNKSIVRFSFPLGKSGTLTANPISVDIYRNVSGYQILDIPYYTNISYDSPSYLYLSYIPPFSAMVIHLHSNSGFTFYNRTASVQYLPIDSEDYYKISQFILQNHIDNDLHKQNTILERFKELYASDDLIASKEAQEQYEQDSLTDFTGGGTAAASGTDRNGLKSVSNTAKSGFDSGGSISDGLSVFNSNNSIWGWFSQDNANYFTTNRSLMKSNNNSELITEIPDYLSTSDKYMIDNLGDNNDKSYSK